MSDKEIFIVGAKGQLGTALMSQYPGARWADIDELDITNKKSVKEFDWSGIDILINAAAYTKVDNAETEEGRVIAWSVNADAVANLVAVAAQHNMTLIHISTDYVFDGAKEPHYEDEPFSPLNVYGASKAAGDIAVSLAPKFYILRTSWVIGEGKNFVRTMLDLGLKGVHPKVVSDETGRLTFTSQLVSAVEHMLKNNLPYGTYNVSSDGPTTNWADIAREVYKIANLDTEVTDIKSADYFADKVPAALRPLNSTLDLSKLKTTGFTPTDWRDELMTYIEKELQK